MTDLDNETLNEGWSAVAIRKPEYGSLFQSAPLGPGQDVVQWCNEVCQGQWEYIWLREPNTIEFEKEDDAVLFQLTWL